MKPILPQPMAKKHQGKPLQEADIAWVEVGDTLRWWDKRIEGWRPGTVKTIGPVYFHVLTAHKVRTVKRSDKLYLMREGESLLLVGGDK